MATSRSLPTLRQLLARLHLRLILFALALAAIALVAGGVLVLRASAARGLDQLARASALALEPAVLAGDRAAMNGVLARLAPEASARRIEVIGRDGAVLARWDHRDGTGSELEVLADRLIGPPPVSAPVGAAGMEVRIEGSAYAILRFAQSGLMIVASLLALALVATRVLARRLEEEVAAPLSALAEIAHQVSSDRAFDRRVPSSGIAEVDRLGQDFNTLLAELQGWHAGITSRNAELARQASEDALTGLGNRAVFDAALGEAIAAARADGSALGLLYFDVDALKQVNDQRGHAAGDAALLEVAARLRRAIRKEDLAFRLGGDEFAILLAPMPGDPGLAAGVAERIRSVLCDGPSSGDAVSLSAGVAIFPGDGETGADLLRHADAAMYRDKKRKLAPQGETEA